MDQKLNYQLPLVENITWQYDEAKNLIGLVDSKGQWYTNNWEGFWEGWYTSIFNLKTANLFGCVVWAIILDIPIGLVYTPPVGGPPAFGFGNGRGNFNYANFSNGGGLPLLTPDEARKLLRIRYYAQTMSTSVSNINGMLKDVFSEDGLAYVEETVGGAKILPFGFGAFNQNFAVPSNFNSNLAAANVQAMAQRYIFTFPLSPTFVQVLQTYLPRGAGVQTQINIQ